MDTLKRQQFIAVLWLQDWFASAWKQEREDSGDWRKIKTSFPGEALKTGNWQDDIRRGCDKGVKQTHWAQQRQRAVWTAWGGDYRSPNSYTAQGGESIWTATLCFGEIIHRARERMTNASSLRLQLWSHKLSKLRNSQSLEYSPNTNK